MREVWKRLPSWNYGEAKAGATERDLWHLDQKINDRGVLTDQALVSAAIRATDAEQARLKKQVQEHTDGYVTAASQRDRMLEFIFAEYGIGMADLTKSAVAKMLERTDLDPMLQELLEIRAQASRSSTSKYKAFQRAANDDNRVRGMLQFSGAARTRRDAGRTVQLQNLGSRGLLPQDQIEIGIDALMAKCEDLVFPDIMHLTASTIRSVIIAPPGKKLVVSDLSNIEGRGLAWLAGEEWKLQAFRDFDNGTGPDLYKLAYAKAFRISPDDVTKLMRQIGKVMELGLGYAGGINAFITFALVYGIDLEEMANTAWDTLPGDIVADAEGFVQWLQDKGTRWPMSLKAATVCEVFKRMWRGAHPMTVKLWRELEDGFKVACTNPGETFAYRGFKFRRDGAWLRIQLPSGRCLCYPHPQIDESGQCSFMGVNQFTRKWERVKTYGGKLSENATQSVARDFLFDNLPHVEDAGYEVTMRVHDEVITETPDSDAYSAAGLSRLLSVAPSWGEGMPLAAAGFESYRYRKD
jgi:DNA polymerase